MTTYPSLHQVVLDTTRPRELAEFYRELLGLRYREGDEPAGRNERPDWLALRHLDGRPEVAFQLVATLPQPTWPHGQHPQMLHLDLTVPDTAELDRQHERTLRLGAQLLLDRDDDPDEPLYVYADPSGHPFCIFVAGVNE